MSLWTCEFRNRMEHGIRCSGAVPYGYKMAEDKTLLVDDEAAVVVKRIFAMAADGTPLAQIAKTLKEDNILIPSAYWEQKEGMVSRNHRYHDPYMWTNAAIAYILDRKEYLGHTVLGKTVRDSFKSKKRRKATEDELLFFPDTHEPIVNQDTWDRANKLRKRAPKKNPAQFHLSQAVRHGLLRGLRYKTDLSITGREGRRSMGSDVRRVPMR